MARQCLDYVELVSPFDARGEVTAVLKAPASRTHSDIIFVSDIPKLADTAKIAARLVLRFLRLLL